MAEYVQERREPGDEVDRLANRVIGAAIEVHKALGPGFMEAVYEEALCVELELRGIPFIRQAPICVVFKSRTVGEGRVDILVDNMLVVELKAVESLAPIHKAQVRSYLKATGCKLGLLLNFNTPWLRDAAIKRVVLT
jgi:GxxExxY protein